jgi:hypothetical protein
MRHPPPDGKLPPTAATVERAANIRTKHRQLTAHPAFRNNPRLLDNGGDISLRRLLSSPPSVCDAHIRELRRQGRFGEAQYFERASLDRLERARAFVRAMWQDGGRS